MKQIKFREMSVEELQKKALELKQTHLNFRFQHASGQLDNSSMLLKTKRDIARILSVINEKQKATKTGKEA
jgi:large subunit ribosomal protein L29